MISLQSIIYRYGYIIILAALGYIAYMDSVHVGFIADDFYYLKSGLSIQNLNEFLDVQIEHGRLIPLHFMYFMISTHLFGMNPAYYHITNIIVHILCGILLYHIILHLARKRTAALTGAVLFIVFYKGSSQVIWTTNIHGLMVTLWYLTTILLFLYWLQTKKRRFYRLALFTFGLALLTKEEAVTVLPVLIVAWLIISGKAARFSQIITTGFWIFIPYILVLAGYLMAHSWLSAESSQEYTSVFVLMENMQRISVFIEKILQNFKWFVTILFLPEFMYGGQSDEPVLIKYGLVVLKMLIIPGLGVLLWLKGDGVTRFFLAFICFSMSLYLIFTVAPRYVYLPSAGVCALMGYLLIMGLERLPGAWYRVRMMVPWLVVVCFVIINIQETDRVIQRWRDAGQKVSHFLTQLRTLKPNPSPYSRLGFVNLPVSGKPYVYTLHTGLDEAVELTYNDFTLEGLLIAGSFETSETQADVIFEYRDGVLVERN